MSLTLELASLGAVLGLLNEWVIVEPVNDLQKFVRLLGRRPLVKLKVPLRALTVSRWVDLGQGRKGASLSLKRAENAKQRIKESLPIGPYNRLKGKSVGYKR